MTSEQTKNDILPNDWNDIYNQTEKELLQDLRESAELQTKSEIVASSEIADMKGGKEE